MKVWLVVVLLIVVLLVGGLLGYLGGCYTHSKLSEEAFKEFLKFRLFEVVNLLFTLAAGSFLAYLYNMTISRKAKRNDLVRENYSSIHKDCCELSDLLDDFMANPSPKGKQTLVTLGFKGVEAQLSILKLQSQRLGD